MKKFTDTLRKLFKREEMKAFPKVNPKSEIKDPVYYFFVHEKSNERKRVYDKALKAAEADQKEILRKYERQQKDLVSA